MRKSTIIFLVVISFLLPVSLTYPEGNSPDTLRQALRAIDGKRNYEALGLLASYTPADDERPLVFYLKGRALLGIKKYREAVGSLSSAYITARDRRLKERALYERGVAYLLGGFYYEAASNFKLFIKHYPRSGLLEEAYRNYAQASLKTGNYVDALTFFRKSKETPETVFGKAEVFQRLGLYKTADALYSKGLISYEDYIKGHPDVLYYYAENLRLNRKPVRAKPLFYLLMESPLRDKAYLSLGLIEYEGGNLDTAKVYFKKAAEASGRVVKRRALLFLGKTLRRLGDTGNAKEKFLLLRMDYPYTPESDEALLLLAGIAREEGRYLDAAGFLKEILFGRKPSEAALDELDVLVRESLHKDFGSFLKIWKECGNWLLSPSRGKTLLEVADVMSTKEGDFLRIYNFLAKEGSREAKIDALSRLASFYGRLGDAEKLKREVGKLRGLKTTGDRVLRPEALLSYLKGDPGRAYVLLMKIEDYKRDDIGLLWKLVDGAGSISGFVRDYKMMAKAVGLPLRYELIGDTLAERGYPKEAVKYYVLALKSDPGSDRVSFKLALISGDKEGFASISGKKDIYGAMARTFVEEESLKARMMEM